MSIIDDVRINQNFNKDGKYVCDLNHKEITEVRHGAPNLATGISVGKFVWCYNGIEIKDKSDTIDPVAFMDAAVSWFEYSKRYKWSLTSKTVSRERYLTLVISALEDLI